MFPGWWFGTWILFFHILGISSSQLTNSYFSEGWLNHQPVSYSWTSIFAHPLVNCHITMENHHFEWENQRTKSPFSSSQTVCLPESNGKSPFLIGKSTISMGHFTVFNSKLSIFSWSLLHQIMVPFEVSAVHFGCDKVVRCLLRANAQWDKAWWDGRCWKVDW